MLQQQENLHIFCADLFHNEAPSPYLNDRSQFGSISGHITQSPTAMARVALGITSELQNPNTWPVMSLSVTARALLDYLL